MLIRAASQAACSSGSGGEPFEYLAHERYRTSALWRYPISEMMKDFHLQREIIQRGLHSCLPEARNLLSTNSQEIAFA